MAGMIEPSLDDPQTLIEYARRKYDDERLSLAEGLRPVREALARLYPRAQPGPPGPAATARPSTRPAAAERR